MTATLNESRPWYAATVDEVMAAQDSSSNGLTETTARRRLSTFGPNRLPAPRRRGPISRFLAQFNDALIYLLLAAAAVTIVLGHWIDAGVILAVVLVNAVVGFLQEGKAERALDAIRDMLAPKASVIRNGRRKAIAGDDVVPGDIVLLEAGDRVPADLRLIDANGLKIDEAVLTGESMTVDKTVTPVSEQASLGDRKSMAFSGTLVTYGRGQGVVVATGSCTEIGRISGMLTDVSPLETPLLRQMRDFATWMAVAIIGLATLVLAFGLLVRGYGFAEIFMAVVGLSVAAIPEGLPAIFTITLAIGAQNMAQRHTLVRRLPAIETLGSVSVICTDKTGTLTRNEMTVASIATADRLYQISGVGYAIEGTFSLDGRDIDAARDPLLTDLTRAGLLCSDAGLRQSHGQSRIDGDPMEGALLVVAAKAGLDPEAERRAWPRLDTIPFDSSHQFMASLHRDPTGDHRILIKGAPERIVAMCRHECRADGDQELISKKWLADIDALASLGQRVLAIATKAIDRSTTEISFGDVEHGMTLLGLVGLIDPPREEAVASIEACREAGIQVKMITGDHAVTAAAIARELGLENPSSVLTGVELDQLNDDELRACVKSSAVFARTSPAHKLRLVQALQSQGLVVAMTGDGVNDAPALKRADVGISMGQKGSEAAKEASEIVLVDDNFATIVDAVRAGRTVYDNIKKAILFILPTSGGEALVLIGAILLGATLPITPVQILWVNMVTAVTLGLALAFEPSESDVMRRPPRATSEPILSRFLMWRTVFVSTLFMIAIFTQFALATMQGASTAEARTVVVNTLVVMEIFYLFSVRYLGTSSIHLAGALGTPAVLASVGAVTVLQLLFTYTPFMAVPFDTQPLRPTQGLQIVAFGIALLLIVEAEKRLVGRLGPYVSDPSRR
ncbi:MAG: cation-transporting P-type ATPase [Pseudomonadota bacterium]